MSKKRSNIERAPLALQRVLGGWRPLHAFAEEQMAAYPLNAVVEMTPHMERSPEHNALYWVVLKQCVDNSDNKYGTTQDLHKALKIALGYKHEIKLLGVGAAAVSLKKLDIAMRKSRVVATFATATAPSSDQAKIKETFDQMEALLIDLRGQVGDTIVLPGSTAFDRMDQSEFRVYFDAAMNELRRAAYPVDDYLEEARKKLLNRQAPLPLRRQDNGSSQAPPDGNRKAETKEKAETAA